MQIKKEDVKNSILDSAREEFLEKGFTGGSLNSIASRADLSKGAIYSYFKSKNDLFYHLVSSTIEYLQDYINKIYSNKDSMKWINDFEMSMEEFRRFSKEVVMKDKEFKLLFFCAEGSELSEFREDLIQQYHKTFNEFLENTGLGENAFTEMFLHTLARTYISFIEEIVLHSPYEEEIDRYAREMAVFMHGGFKNIYLLKKEDN